MSVSSILICKEQNKPQFRALNKEDKIDLEEHIRSLKHQRDSLSQKLLENLKMVDSNCEDLNKAIFLNLQNVGLHFFKDVIQSINDKLDRNDNFLNFKQKEFAEKEKQLSDELREIEQVVLDTRAGISTVMKRPLQYKPLETYHVNLPESICTFDEFIQKFGGHSGGWKPEDHQLFLSLKNKYSMEKVAEIITEKIPDISITKVTEHDAWYDKYMELLASKKQAIETWKLSRRRTERSQSVGSLYQSEETHMQKPTSVTQRKPQSDLDVKKRIAKWKLERELRLKQEEANKNLIEQRNRITERDKREIQMMQREKFLQYKEAKIKYELDRRREQDLLRREEKINKSRKANIMIQVFRKQDEQKLQAKLDKKKQVIEKKLENTDRLRRVKCSVNVKREPNRLRRPTSGWRNKISGDNMEEELELRTQWNVNHISHVAHLKVPEWKQDVKYDDQITL